METLQKYPKRILLGEDEHGASIYYYSPTWDCGWYWGFGYLGNNDCHYHLSGLMGHSNLYDGLKEHFGTTLCLRESHIWTFAELVKTAYSLQETAEVLGRGVMCTSSNPVAEIIKNPEEVIRINKVVLPAIFDAIHNLLVSDSDLEEMLNTAAYMNFTNGPEEVVRYMKEAKLTPDDIKSVFAEGTPNYHKDTYSKIHSAYWKDYHANK